MINLDDANLISQAINVDGVYHVEVRKSTSGPKKVLLDGEDCKYVIFADTNKGYLIRHKTTIDGRVVTVGDEPVFEILFGKVEVTFDGMDQQTERLH
ncbi:hypothetical protein CAT36_07550 [Acinetobacter pittii]|uniref:hypothetical protein n=1 Tax=Acinetobacter pittii TaxID=48296 RepID=UPI000A395662|nr:hypothetical protein [Acinetobacter pittii]OTU51869.1 hypothetical protein CAT36_07550 [Acinetobacter pittii]